VSVAPLSATAHVAPNRSRTWSAVRSAKVTLLSL
jgi:hypothetical protein